MNESRRSVKENKTVEGKKQKIPKNKRKEVVWIQKKESVNAISCGK